MPFFNHDESFVDTIDALQSFIDINSALAPIKLIYDFNVQLPNSNRLHGKWYSKPGYNRHSAIMYDFLVGNWLSIDSPMITVLPLSSGVYASFTRSLEVFTKMSLSEDSIMINGFTLHHAS